jgi:hypothetical protein
VIGGLAALLLRQSAGEVLAPVLKLMSVRGMRAGSPAPPPRPWNLFRQETPA